MISKGRLANLYVFYVRVALSPVVLFLLAYDNSLKLIAEPLGYHTAKNIRRMVYVNKYLEKPQVHFNILSIRFNFTTLKIV